MSTASQFLPNLPPVSIFSYLQQVQPERFGKKYTLLQQFRAMQPTARDLLQKVERGDRSRLPELCALGARYRRLRNDLLHMLSAHMAKILREMRRTPGNPLDGALDKSAKALGEGAKILESMDSGTLQKVFEQSGDYITAQKLVREQPGKPEEWSAAAKLEALKLILDNATRYIPLPDGTDAFFKFYSQAIGAIIKGIAPIEERNRKLQLAKLQPEAIRGYKNLKTWEQWYKWIKKRQEEGIPPGVVEDAFKLAWIGTYLESNRDLTKELLADTTGEQIARLCAEGKPSREGTVPAPPQKPQDQPKRAGLPPRPSQAEKTGREEFEPGPVEGVSPPESALSPEEAGRRRRCQELTKEADEAEKKCEQKQEQVRAARQELAAVIHDNQVALDKRGAELESQAKEEDAKAIQGIEGQIKKLKGQIEKQEKALGEKRKARDAWAQGENERLESLMGKWKDALKKSQATLDQDDQAFQKWKEARDEAAAGEDKAFDEMVQATRASDATSDQVYAACEEYMRADRALEKAKAKREGELEKLDAGIADLKEQVHALEKDRDTRLAALQKKRNEELERLGQTLEETKVQPVSQKLRRLEQEAIEICDQARERRREQQRVCRGSRQLRPRREHAAAEALPGDHAQPSTRLPQPARPAEPAAAKPAGPGLREGNRWVPGVLIAGGLIISACLVGGGWAVVRRIRHPEPAAITGHVTVTPPPQPGQEAVPVPGAEAVLTPTLTLTPTPTPTPSPTPTEAPPSEPQDVVFKAADGQKVMGTYYPPPACPSPLTIVYFPWVRGDKEDAREIIDLLPEDLSYGVFAITPRGCDGGCQEWTPSAWLLDYQAAIEYAKTLPCAGQGPIVTFGSSVGADGAIVACAREARCEGAFAVSPGGYTDEFTYADEVVIAVERGKPVWSIVSEDDPESAQLDRPGLGDGYREIVIPGGDHGNQLYDERTAQVIQDFVECATNAFASPRCLEALAEDHLAKGNEHLERAQEHYQDHDCEHWIPEAEQAIAECTAALQLDPEDAKAYFCRALGYTHLEEPAKAIGDLERALELGLMDKQKDDAEEMLAGLKEGVAAPACSIGPILFMDGWTGSGGPLNPSETCSPDITDEIQVAWELYGSCDQRFVVKWGYNGRLTCFHPYEPWEHEQWEGSMYHTEGEENLPGGTWTVSVSVGGQEIGSASCDIPRPEVEPPIPATLFLAFNTAQPPFDAPSVRRALAMAIDREALLDVLGQEGKSVATGLVPPSIWADESYYGQADVPFDPKRALALLGGEQYYEWEVDWASRDEVLALASESSLEVAQFIQAQWKEHLGIEVELAVVEEDAYAEGLEALSPHVFLASWHADYKSPYNFLGDAIQDIGKLTKWSNAEYDRLAGEAFQEVHQERRMELCSQAEVILIHGHAIIPLYHYIHHKD